MPKLIYELLSDIPEAARIRAVETPNGFEVDATPLLNNHADLLQQLHRFRSLAERAKEFDGIDAEKARRALEEWDEAERFNRDVAKAVEEKEREWREREAAWMEQISQSQIASALVEARGIPKVLAPYVRTRVKPEVQNGTVILHVFDEHGALERDQSSGKPLTVNDLVQRLRKDPEFAGGFTDSRAHTSAVGTSMASSSPPSIRFQSDAHTIRLTREQARNPQVYREAVRQAGGDQSRVQIDQE